MKKILFTCALLLAFGSTKASNDNPTTKNENEVVVIKEKVVSNLDEQTKPLLLPSCWQLSCGAVCDFRPNATEIWGQFDIEIQFAFLEAAICY